MTERAGLSRAVGDSLSGAATMPLRFVLWILRGLLWLAVPAFLFAALLHYSAGDVGRVPWDVAYLVVCSIALGMLRFVRNRLGM